MGMLQRRPSPGGSFPGAGSVSESRIGGRLCPSLSLASMRTWLSMEKPLCCQLGHQVFVDGFIVQQELQTKIEKKPDIAPESETAAFRPPSLAAS
jgi:hypothetical protein